jgi:hypothetical protein
LHFFRFEQKNMRSNLGRGQGCQIFLGATYQNGKKIPEWQQNIPNGSKIDEMSVKFTNIFYCKSLQNLPKLAFLIWKYTIWQPWSRLKVVVQFSYEMCKPLKARWQQGDQMSLLKNDPKCSPTLFCQNQYLHNFYRGKIVATKFGLCMYSCNFRENFQSKQSPKMRKVAQSGHTGWQPVLNSIEKKKSIKELRRYSEPGWPDWANFNCLSDC